MKTSELTGAALNWAVAKAGGETPKVDCASFRGAFIYCIYLGWSYDNEGRDSIIPYKPSTDWALGGPIIEREAIQLTPDEYTGTWFAYMTNEGEPYKGQGSSPLIAAMRCYVASKMGDAIDIPKELS